MDCRAGLLDLCGGLDRSRDARYCDRGGDHDWVWRSSVDPQEAGVTHGSQLQVQIYVNRRSGDLTEAVLGALPSLARQTRKICWTVPLEHEGFAEPKDEAFLRAVGWGDLAAELAEFWPARGPVWDALAVAVLPDRRPGVVLAEGKSYPEEFRGVGAKAGDVSRDKISNAIAATQHWLGAEEAPDLWLGDLYQSANRLAHLYWLREVAQVEAWLVYLLFTDDYTHRAASREEWDEAIPLVDEDLGLASHSEIAGHTYLPALAAEELTHAPERATPRLAPST
jgi:hypothetical protein